MVGTGQPGTRIKRSCGVAMMAALLALAGVGSTSAHTRTHEDADDSAGSLDISSVSFTHRDGKVRLTIRTYEAWEDAFLAHQYRDFLIDLKTRSNPKYDFRIVIDFDQEAGLTARLWDKEKNEWVGNLRVRRPSATSVRVRVAKKRLDVERDSAVWHVYSSSFEGEGDCEDGCYDRAPEYGLFFRHFW